MVNNKQGCKGIEGSSSSGNKGLLEIIFNQSYYSPLKKNQVIAIYNCLKLQQKAIELLLLPSTLAQLISTK
ncbi:hypothetical protein FGO68_gene15802 [Halteria grandinella]|uniref:Uncharacterized protein n=1 Tax=Halteria grandinella TaxID=5974 RepID=A0A8J8NEM6_HALGN|nr:hypothetical protein FGO68_gene15802 [Halteria grandinella]